MSSYEENLARHRRLSILRTLTGSQGKGNESILRDALVDLGLGAGLTRQIVRDELRFLETCGAVQLTWYGNTLVVASITERGVDIAEGNTLVDGIKRPSLGMD
jgi:hypothetical protein